MSVMLYVTMAQTRTLRHEVTDELAALFLTEEGRLELQEKCREIYRCDTMLVTVKVEDDDAETLS